MGTRDYQASEQRGGGFLKSEKNILKKFRRTFEKDEDLKNKIKKNQVK